MDSLESPMQENNSTPIDGVQNAPIPTDAYDVDVDTAASLLGVGRTRLSQITSKGALSFQRRKIGIRNRLFYRRSELLSYLERQFPNSPQFRSQTIAERWAQPQSLATEDSKVETSETSHEELQVALSETLQRLAALATSSTPPRTVAKANAAQRTRQPLLQSALEGRRQTERNLELSNLNQKLDLLMHSVRLLCAKIDATNLVMNRLQHQQRQAPQPLRSTPSVKLNEPSLTEAELRRILKSVRTPKSKALRGRSRKGVRA